MSFTKARSFGVVVFAFALASCSGGGGPMNPTGSNISVPQQGSGTSPLAASKSVDVALSAAGGNFTLPASPSVTGTLSVSSDTAAGTTIGLSVAPGATARQKSTSRSTLANAPACSVPLQLLSNRSSRPITLKINAYTLSVGCDVTGQLFGVSSYQQSPQPATLVASKLGNATGSRTQITFAPNAGGASVTLPPFTTTAIATVPEMTTDEVGLPVAPGSTTVLTSNSNIVNSKNQPENLSFTYTSSSGGSLYGIACKPAFTSSGVLAAALQGVAIVGTPKFYCSFDPGSSSITFGTAVTFAIANLDPDIGFIELDGPPVVNLCTNTSNPSCTTGQFTIGADTADVQNVVVGNVKDLTACIGTSDTTDCNNTQGLASPPPAATSVGAGQQRELLVADDPTYKNDAAHNLPFGGFTLTIPAGSSCRIDQGSDQNSDEPAGYADPGGPQEAAGSTSTSSTFPNVGPNVAFDIDMGASGTTCIVNITETSAPHRTITYSIPTH